MGRAVTEYVLSQDSIAIATLRRPEVLADLSAKYGKDKLLLLKLDVTHPQEILDAFAKAKEVFGRIDVVYNNAGGGTCILSLQREYKLTVILVYDPQAWSGRWKELLSTRHELFSI